MVGGREGTVGVTDLLVLRRRYVPASDLRIVSSGTRFSILDTRRAVTRVEDASIANGILMSCILAISIKIFFFL